MAKQKEPNKSSETKGVDGQESRSTEAESRRRALRRLLVGGGLVAGAQLPQKWARPVVDSVLLPAHAAGSPPPDGENGGHPVEEGNPFTEPQPNPFVN